MDEREKLIKQAYEMKLSELAEKVIRGSFTLGVHDVVLLERCKQVNP